MPQGSPAVTDAVTCTSSRTRIKALMTSLTPCSTGRQSLGFKCYLSQQLNLLSAKYPFLTLNQIKARALDSWNKLPTSDKYIKNSGEGYSTPSKGESLTQRVARHRSPGRHHPMATHQPRSLFAQANEDTECSSKDHRPTDVHSSRPEPLNNDNKSLANNTQHENSEQAPNMTGGILKSTTCGERKKLRSRVSFGQAEQHVFTSSISRSQDAELSPFRSSLDKDTPSHWIRQHKKSLDRKRRYSEGDMLDVKQININEAQKRYNLRGSRSDETVNKAGDAGEKSPTGLFANKGTPVRKAFRLFKMSEQSNENADTDDISVYDFKEQQDGIASSTIQDESSESCEEMEVSQIQNLPESPSSTATEQLPTKSLHMSPSQTYKASQPPSIRNLNAKKVSRIPCYMPTPKDVPENRPSADNITEIFEKSPDTKPNKKKIITKAIVHSDGIQVKSDQKKNKKMSQIPDDFPLAVVPGTSRQFLSKTSKLPQVDKHRRWSSQHLITRWFTPQDTQPCLHDRDDTTERELARIEGDNFAEDGIEDTVDENVTAHVMEDEMLDKTLVGTNEKENSVRPLKTISARKSDPRRTANGQRAACAEPESSSTKPTSRNVDNADSHFDGYDSDQEREEQLALLAGNKLLSDPDDDDDDDDEEEVASVDENILPANIVPDLKLTAHKPTIAVLESKSDHNIFKTPTFSGVEKKAMKCYGSQKGYKKSTRPAIVDRKVTQSSVTEEATTMRTPLARMGITSHLNSRTTSSFYSKKNFAGTDTGVDLTTPQMSEGILQATFKQATKPPRKRKRSECQSEKGADSICPPAKSNAKARKSLTSESGGAHVNLHQQKSAAPAEKKMKKHPRCNVTQTQHQKFPPDRNRAVNQTTRPVNQTTRPIHSQITRIAQTKPLLMNNDLDSTGSISQSQSLESVRSPDWLEVVSSQTDHIVDATIRNLQLIAQTCSPAARAISPALSGFSQLSDMSSVYSAVVSPKDCSPENPDDASRSPTLPWSGSEEMSACWTTSLPADTGPLHGQTPQEPSTTPTCPELLQGAEPETIMDDKILSNSLNPGSGKASKNKSALGSTRSSISKRNKAETRSSSERATTRMPKMSGRSSETRQTASKSQRLDQRETEVRSSEVIRDLQVPGQCARVMARDGVTLLDAIHGDSIQGAGSSTCLMDMFDEVPETAQMGQHSQTDTSQDTNASFYDAQPTITGLFDPITPPELRQSSVRRVLASTSGNTQDTFFAANSDSIFY